MKKLPIIGKKYGCRLSLLLLSFASLCGAEIKHRFLVFDEARHQLVHINEKDASQNWKLQCKGRAWDMQLVGNDQVALSTPNGYTLVDLKTGQQIESVKVDGLSGAWSTRRMPNGRAIAIGARNGGLFAAELDQQNKILRTAEVPNAHNLRFGRVTAEGHALAVPEDELIEWDLDGNIIARFKLPYDKLRKKHLNSFMALKDRDGNYWVSYGYNAELVKLDSNGKLLKRFSGPAGSNFFAGFQRLPNGNLVQANWAGHKPETAANGKQLVEFNPQGNVVWSFHDTEAFSCPVSVIVLDQLDTKKPAGDQSGTLKNFQRDRRVALGSINKEEPSTTRRSIPIATRQSTQPN